jgi:ATP-GRASP peptide maturase of grasp-with-spasm system
MVLICSNSDDVSTISVIKWLAYRQIPYRLLVEGAQIQQITIDDGGERHLTLNTGEQIPLNELASYWYRRGASRFNKKNQAPDTPLTELARRTEQFLNEESRSVADYIEYHLVGKRHISSLKTSHQVNKLILADMASRAGLLVPDSIITTHKADLIRFYQTHTSIITKPIEIQIDYVTTQHWVPMYTEEITEEILNRLPDTFNVSLFQQKITKQYELRIFCLNGEKYAMAIFSQRDQQTAVDFRKYNIKKPNRNVPFLLPAAITEKIDRFLTISGYRCGSIDMLVDEKGAYYFLEINPVGQFGMVSMPCNYHLEEKIADYLANG